MSANWKAVPEIGLGFLYLVGAIFNALWTLGHSQQFFGSFADQAMLPSSRRLVRAVVLPRARPLAGLLVAYLAAMAYCILGRGDLVTPGLLAGAVFCLGAALVSSAGGAIANLTMAAIQIFLAYTR